MTTGHVFIGTSLDGFIARQNGDIAWLTGFSAQGEDHGFDAHMARVDAVVMGRGTYDAIKDMRPWYYSKPVVVLSRTLTQADVPGEIGDKVEISMPGRKRPWRRLRRADGSGSMWMAAMVILSFLRAGLIEDMVISRIPC